MAIRARRRNTAKHMAGSRHPRSSGNEKINVVKKRYFPDNATPPESKTTEHSFFNSLIKFFSYRIKAPKQNDQPARRSLDRYKGQGHLPDTAAAAPAGSFFKDWGVLLTSLACIAVVVASVVAVPVAFAKSGATVNLLDSGRTFTAQTSAKTVGEFLEKNNIELGSQDMLETSADQPIHDGMDIIIRRAMPLTVNAGADTKNISMIAGTVSQALQIAGVNVDADDEVYPSADSYVRPGMTIDYIDVQVKFDTVTKTIGYKEVTREDDDMMKGDSEIVQYGEEGEKETKTKQTFKNGVLYSQEVVSEVVTKEPVNEILAVGTKVVHESSSSIPVSDPGSGGPSSDQIREVRTMQATAYAGDTMTSTGVYPRVASGSSYGTVAADPDVLPYGTMLYIPGYGYGRVEDTGGFVNQSGGSNIIDLFMSSESACYDWGRRSVTVYILN